MANKPRIAVFQAEWPLQVHTLNSVLVLTESGFEVDVFLYRVEEHFVDGQLDGIPGVRISRLGELERSPTVRSATTAAGSAPTRRGVIRRIASRIGPLKSLARGCWAAYLRYYPVWLDRRNGLTPAAVLRETFRAMKGHSYRVLIGVEKAGLVWAGQVAERLNVPYLYHSLELYTREKYGPTTSISSRCLKRAEERYHRGSYATIIQDPRRAEVLFADTGARPNRTLLVPVSLLGPPKERRCSFFQERFGLDRDRILILKFGLIHRENLGVELTHEAQRFPEKWLLVMHGPPPPDARYVEQIRRADTNRRVVLSMELVPAARIPEVVSSAHVGLALYPGPHPSDRLLAFSSEKLALYLQCGVPVIAFAHPGYEILELRRCGAVIERLDQLPTAVERVLASWDEFSNNARICFSEHYEFRRNYRKVVEMLESLS